MTRIRLNKIGGLFFLTMIFTIIFIFIKYSREDTLTIGVFCGSNWNVPGTEYYKLFDEAVERFHEKYPNIKIKYEEGIVADDYSQWLAGNILKGKEPDIYLVLPGDFEGLVKRGALKNLNEEILSDADFDQDAFYPSVYKAGKVNGIQYALPFECNPRMMFVNKTLLKKVGEKIPENDWTWDEFSRICEKIEKEPGQNYHGYYDYSWLDAVYANGITPFNEDGRESNFMDSRMVSALNHMKNLQEICGDTIVKEKDYDLGNVAFRPMSFAEYRTYMPYPWRIKKYSQFQWNCVPMPAGKSGDNISSMDTLMIGMSTRTINKSMSWEFMKMLTSDMEIQSSIYHYTAGASVLKKVTCSDEIVEMLNKDTPGESEIDMSLLDQVIEKAVVPHYFTGYNTAMELTDSYISQLLTSDDEMNLRLFEVKKKINKIIK